MTLVRYVLFGVLAAATAALPSAALAFPFAIPTGSTSSDDIVFNFDFTGVATLPLSSASFTAIIVDGSSTDTITIDGFNGLNGAGGSFYSTTLTSGSLLSPHLSLPGAGISDGVFSLGFRLDGGTASIGSVFVQGFPEIGSETIPGVLAVTSVPESGTLSLLALGLAVLALGRRRLSRSGDGAIAAQ